MAMAPASSWASCAGFFPSCLAARKQGKARSPSSPDLGRSSAMSTPGRAAASCCSKVCRKVSIQSSVLSPQSSVLSLQAQGSRLQSSVWPTAHGPSSVGQFGQGLVVVGLLRRDAVPANLVFHEAHALALDGAGADHGRLALHRAGPGQGLQDLGEVVAVDLLHGPPEGPPFVGHGLDVHHLLHLAVDLQAVEVMEDAEVVELVVGSFPKPMAKNAVSVTFSFYPLDVDRC